MSEQCVDPIGFDFLPRLPIVVEAKDVQVSSDAGIPALWRLHDFFIDEFIRSFPEPPTRITLDLDATGPRSCRRSITTIIPNAAKARTVIRNSKKGSPAID